ncbi:uncharacterized protein PV09_08784 [Verruconis gallopava]|uniref:Uncharacterized protein n=1 Tax=Verruconis gallopava TaxID=253628 RepID=A0A0D1ZZZ3_9PEZI|nr:uncharacterized protein PV09_08784 [Verruconis gallopava]KIV99609.1 hypothetical protein PV09_08784 [Verruconis gallopava]
MEKGEHCRQKSARNFEELETSEFTPPETPSEYDPFEQGLRTSCVSREPSTVRLKNAPKQTSNSTCALYTEDLEQRDWAFSSTSELCDNPALPTVLEKSTCRVPNRFELQDEHEVSSPSLGIPVLERMTLTGKALRPRSLLSSSAAKLGLSRQNDSLVESTSRTRRKSVPKTCASQPSARNVVRQQILTSTKTRRDIFIYHNRSLLLPLLPPKNYVEQLSFDKSAFISIYEDVAQPAGINATLKPYQVKGLSFLVHMHNNGMPAILGDEMGLGKTLQTLSLFQYLKEKELRNNALVSEELRPFLVICPLTVLENWVLEARKFAPKLEVLRFHGPVNEREFLKDEWRKRKRDALRYSKSPVQELQASPYDLVITTYDSFRAESSWFRSVAAWRYVVLDEGHRIKNYRTQESRSLQSIQAEYRIILTGTPLQNNLIEMWSLFHWLFPDIFTENSLQMFREAFNLTKGQVNREIIDHCRRLLELIMLRRMKNSAEVSLNLPPKEVIRLFVPLTRMQKKWYLKLLTQQSDDMLEEIYRGAHGKEQQVLQMKDVRTGIVHDDSTQAETISMSHSLAVDYIDNTSFESTPRRSLSPASNQDSWRRLLNLALQLRKVCTHPYLVPDAAPSVNYIGSHIYENSGKFMALRILIDEIVVRQGKKMLVFSNFTEVLDWAEDLVTLISESGTKFQCIRLDGATVRAKRNLYVRLFQQIESNYRIFLISTKAGGVGLNLTAATEAVFMDEDWNPQVDLQAEARCHRIGQTKPVTIYKLCTSGSVEEQMLGRIHKKLYLSAKITEAMENIYDNPLKTSTNRVQIDQSKSLFGSYSQFKSLLRRGTQTLASASTDADEMANWDCRTMIERCRQKMDLSGSDDEADEERWLATMEKVECAVFEGRNYGRRIASPQGSNMVPTTSREQRRLGKELTVEIDGFAVNKASLACAEWESVPTLAGKSPLLKSRKRTRLKFSHQDHCQQCYESEGLLYECTNCPRVYHEGCMSKDDAKRAKDMSNWSCFQHSCHSCSKKAAEAGGMIFRCRWCPNGYCEDCLDWDSVKLIGDNIDEYKILGFPVKREAYYIACPACNDPELREALEAQAESYRELAKRFDAGEPIELDDQVRNDSNEDTASGCNEQAYIFKHVESVSEMHKNPSPSQQSSDRQNTRHAGVESAAATTTHDVSVAIRANELVFSKSSSPTSDRGPYSCFAVDPYMPMTPAASHVDSPSLVASPARLKRKAGNDAKLSDGSPQQRKQPKKRTVSKT